MTKWIGRSKRADRVTRIKYLIWIIVPVAVFLIVFFLKDKIGDSPKSLFSAKRNIATSPVSLPQLNVDSLLYSILTGLRLDSCQLVAGYNDIFINGKKKYPHYLIKWPLAYPLVWFTREIQSAIRLRDSLRYDAVELEAGRKLKLVIIMGGDTLGQIELAADDHYLPAVSTAAVIIDNFNLLSKSQVLSLVKMRVPFGYIFYPDQIPDGDIAKVLKTCRGECYLRLPTDKNSWQAIMKRTRVGGSGKGARLNDKNLETILHRFPVIDGFLFDESRGIDKETLQTLIKRAKTMNLFYLDIESTSGIIDTILVQNMVKIGIPDRLTDLRSLPSAEFPKRFKIDFGKPAVHPKTIYFLSGQSKLLEALNSLTDFRNKWNVNLMPPSAQLQYPKPF
jgi:hypothetical protein